LFLIVIILINGCIADKTKTYSDFIVDEVDFDTEMKTQPKFSGVISDITDNNTYIYFSNTVSKKKIKVFDTLGREKWVVHLDSICKSGVEISALSVINRDTIFALIAYSNRLLMLDRNGHVFNEITLDAAPFNDGYLYEYFSPCVFAADRKSYTLFVGLGVHDAVDNKPSESELTALKSFYTNLWRSSLVGKVDSLFSDNLHYSNGCNIYKRVFPDDSTRLLVESNKFVLNDGKIYVFSWFSDSIFVYSGDFSFEKAIPIVSEYTSIGFKPVEITTETMNELQRLHNQMLQSNGLISGLYFDSFRGLWYVVVLLEIPKGYYKEKRYRPWALLIYDKDFKKLKEFEFRENKYKPYLLVTKRGVYIQKVPKKKKNGAHKTTFSVFQFNF